VGVAVPQQTTVSGGMLSLKKSIKKRKLPMKRVRLKNLENEYVLSNRATPTAQPMLLLGFPEIALC
jgi:hypothetical protein